MIRAALLTVNVHGLGPEAATVPEEELFGRLAHGRYAYRIGLSRLLDMLRHTGVPATFFWPVFEAERCRPLIERCLAEGHEIASHGNAFEDHATLGAREAEILEAAHERLTAITGTPPIGFRSPTGTLSPATIGILARLGYRYDSSFVDDDVPYLLQSNAPSGIVELPWCEGLCDATHFRRRLTQRRAEAFFIEEFDAMIGAAGLPCLIFHPRADIGVGRTARLAMIERLIERTRVRHGVIFRLCREVAERVCVTGK